MPRPTRRGDAAAADGRLGGGGAAIYGGWGGKGGSRLRDTRKFTVLRGVYDEMCHVRDRIKIDEARNGYKPVAYRTSVLYFCIALLADIDPMCVESARSPFMLLMRCARSIRS